jgi:hypothetical protein
VLWQVLTALAAFAWYAANTLAVNRSIGSVQLPQRLGNLEIAEAVPRSTLRLIALALAAVLALATAYTFSDLDHYVALYRSAEPVGLVEPVLGRDAAFYLARLPLAELLQLLALISVLMTLLLVAGLYALTGSLGTGRRRLRLTPHARFHMVALLAVLALVLAWGFRLDGLQLVGGGGRDGGALSPVDRGLRLPASHALAVIGILTAVGSALALRWARGGILAALWATLLLAAALGRIVIPGLAEVWKVGAVPSVAQALAQYADGWTRAGFGLLRVPPLRLREAETAGPRIGDIEGLAVWTGEPGMVELALDAQRADTGVATTWAVGLLPPGARDGARPEALAVPQTDFVRLRGRPRPSWTDLHRGLRAWGGRPLRLDAGPVAGPLAAVPETALPSARIRFLPRAAELAVVGPDEGSVAEAAPGVPLRSALRRLLLGWSLQAPPLLDDHTSRADRVLYWRDVPTRLERLYRFASFDAARPALIGGRLVWVADGYLASGRFPLARSVRWRGDAVNYLAAPYVATVDAAAGAVRLYLRDPGDRFAASVARAEGAEVLPADSMDTGLRAALVYPAALLAAQAAALAGVGAGTGAPWSLAGADSASASDAALLRVTAVVLDLDGQGRRSWVLTPLADGPGSRLTALLAGAADPATGATQLRFFPVTTPQPTPQAVHARLGASAAVLAALAALERPNGSTRRGTVHVLPDAAGLTFVQPLFTAEAGGAPQLAGIALYRSGRTGFGVEAAAAVRSLQRGGDVAASGLGPGALAEARAAFLAMDSARQRGDWEAFGRAWASLRRALRMEPARPEARP